MPISGLPSQTAARPVKAPPPRLAETELAPPLGVAQPVPRKPPPPHRPVVITDAPSAPLLVVKALPVAAQPAANTQPVAAAAANAQPVAAAQPIAAAAAKAQPVAAAAAQAQPAAAAAAATAWTLYWHELQAAVSVVLGWPSFAVGQRIAAYSFTKGQSQQQVPWAAEGVCPTSSPELFCLGRASAPFATYFFAARKLVDGVDSRCKLPHDGTELDKVDNELKHMSKTVYDLARSVGKCLSYAERGEDGALIVCLRWWLQAAS